MRIVTAALLAATISACSAPNAPTTSIAPAASPQPTATAAPPSAAPTTAAAPPTVPPVPTPTPIVDLSQVFRPLTTGWRPTGPTLIVVSADASGSALVALPISAKGLTGAATLIVRFNGAWGIRADGSALAVAVYTDRGIRVATLDLVSNKSAWVTPGDARGSVSTPVWSKDGATVYYGSVGAGPPDFVGRVSRIRADGGGATEVATLVRFGGLDGLTPDGGGLVWSRVQAGGSVEILDVATGTSRHLDDVARVDSVRARQPRMLLSVGGCCAGRPGGSLVLWNDVAMTSRVIADRQGAVAWGTAQWDPTGTRIVATRYDDADPYQGSLVILDPETGAAQPVAGASGAPALWTDEGVVLERQSGPDVEVVLLPASGGAAISLFKGPSIYRVVMLRP